MRADGKHVKKNLPSCRECHIFMLAKFQLTESYGRAIVWLTVASYWKSQTLGLKLSPRPPIWLWTRLITPVSHVCNKNNMINTVPYSFLRRNAVSSYFHLLELLWIAPELLPLTVTPGSAATQKGDVYSFAIILEEIVVRGGPYEVARTFMTTQEVWLIVVLFNLNFISSYFLSLLLFISKIVSRVSASENPPLRPEVTPKDCPPDILSLMERCWHEIPDERPSFHTIRGTIRGIMKYVLIQLS